jgi:hypothetical protein
VVVLNQLMGSQPSPLSVSQGVFTFTGNRTFFTRPDQLLPDRKKLTYLHGDASHFYPSTLIFYTQHRVNITIYRTVYLHACVNVNAFAIKI